MDLGGCIAFSLFVLNFSGIVSSPRCIPAHFSFFFCLCWSLSLSLSLSIFSPSFLSYNRANPLIIHKLLRLSWQRWQIPTGFNHGRTNEISMANAHGSPSLLPYLSLSFSLFTGTAGYPGCVGPSQGGWPIVKPPGSTWVTQGKEEKRGTAQVKQGSGQNKVHKQEGPLDKIWPHVKGLCLCVCRMPARGAFGNLPQLLPAFEMHQ